MVEVRCWRRREIMGLMVRGEGGRGGEGFRCGGGE